MGPYIVKTIMRVGATRLIDFNGNHFTNPMNLDKLKRFYQWGSWPVGMTKCMHDFIHVMIIE